MYDLLTIALVKRSQYGMLSEVIIHCFIFWWFLCFFPFIPFNSTSLAVETSSGNLNAYCLACTVQVGCGKLVNCRKWEFAEWANVTIVLLGLAVWELVINVSSPVGLSLVLLAQFKKKYCSHLSFRRLSEQWDSRVKSTTSGTSLLCHWCAPRRFDYHYKYFGDCLQFQMCKFTNNDDLDIVDCWMCVTVPYDKPDVDAA